MNNLFDQMTQPENLLAAWRAVRGNVPKYRRASSAGADGVSLSEFERDLPAQLEALRDMLTHGRYTPAPPKLIQLPKPSGGTRTIGVLNVRDRVAQRAAVQVLEPLWEPAFQPSSFGFRPGRGTQHALAYVQTLQKQGAGWVVEGDIEDCFGSLDHELLMKQVQARAHDGQMTQLVQTWLDTGALSAGLPAEDGAAEDPTAWQKAGQMAGRGLGWALEVVFPGALTGPTTRTGRAYPGDDLDEMEAAQWDAPTAPNLNQMAQAAVMRRMAVTGLAAGAAWLRPNVGQAINKAGEVLRTPAGRRLMRSGSLAVAGLAGAAALGAVAAVALRRYAGPGPTGVTQGSPLSPLMANIYLHPFDAWMAKRGHQTVRYADDFVALAPDEDRAEAAYNDTLRALTHLRLRVNRRKMRLVKPGEKWEFLGAVLG